MRVETRILATQIVQINDKVFEVDSERNTGVVNIAFTMEVFILTKNLRVFLLMIPMHGVCMLLCVRDARYFGGDLTPIGIFCLRRTTVSREDGAHYGRPRADELLAETRGARAARPQAADRTIFNCR